jgi:predicted nucleic acid-binding protein
VNCSEAIGRAMSDLFVLDTSVAVAWYLPEVFSKEAREWQRKMIKKTVTMIAPKQLHYLEFSNVLRTYTRRGELTQDLAREIYELHLEAPLREMEPSLPDILETAFKFESTTYDAAYIALSMSNDAPLLTAERSTTPWVVQLGDLVVTMKK